MRRWCAAMACAGLLLWPGTARSGSVEDWLAWRVREVDRALEEQLGISPDGDTAWDALLVAEDVGLLLDREPTGAWRSTVRWRPGVTGPRFRLRLAWSGPMPLVFAVVLGCRFRFGLVPHVEPASPPVPAWRVPTATRSGDPVLDRLQWALLVAEREALRRAVRRYAGAGLTPGAGP